MLDALQVEGYESAQILKKTAAERALFIVNFLHVTNT